MSDPIQIVPPKEAASEKDGAAGGLSVSPDGVPKGPIPATPREGFDEIVDLERAFPLNTPWTFFFDKTTFATGHDDYADFMKSLFTVDTIQLFWQVFNNIPKVGAIEHRCGYHLMRGPLRPMWEDIPDGGSWKFRISKSDSNEVWRELMLAAIGEQYSDSVAAEDRIVGVSLITRHMDDVAQVWNANAKLASSARIIEKVSQLLPGVKFTRSFYKAHREHRDPSPNVRRESPGSRRRSGDDRRQ